MRGILILLLAWTASAQYSPPSGGGGGLPVNNPTFTGTITGPQEALGSAATTTGPELVADPTFTNSPPTGWTLGTCVTHGTNNISVVFAPSCVYPPATTNISLVSGHSYLVTLTVSGISNDMFQPTLSTNTQAFLGQEWGTATGGTFVFSFTSSCTCSDVLRLAPYSGNTGATWTATLASVKEATIPTPLSVTYQDGESLPIYDQVNGNVSLGQSSMPSSGGVSNVAIGAFTMPFNTGQNNVAVGDNSLFSNTTGAQNVAVGGGAGIQNTTGGLNVAVGAGAMFSNATGSNNTIVGVDGLTVSTAGSDNTGIGQFTLSASTGNGNTAVGSNACDAVVTGSNVICVGFSADLSADSSNVAVIGNSSITDVYFGGNVASVHAKIHAASGSLVSPTSTDPTCTAASDIGKFWFDSTTNTTAFKVCKSVAGTVGWSTVTTVP